MEALAAISLVGNIVQFVSFSGKLISNSTQLYHSCDGALQENIDIENVAKHLLLLNKKLKDDAITVGDTALQTLCLSCREAAIDLLEALNKVKVKAKGKQQKWESTKKALWSIWSKGEVEELEQRLLKIKGDLNLHVVMGLREQVSQLRQEYSVNVKELGSATKIILDAVIEQQDVFHAAHEAQLEFMKTRQENITTNIDDIHQEIISARQEIIQAVKWQRLDIAEQERWLDKLPNAAQAAFNASQRQHDPVCLQNTRVNVLKEISAWADGQDERCLYWLNGLAGTGKSTISRTIAHKYFEQGRLGASFFFSRGGGDVGQATKFFTTIAFQLAKTSTSLKNHICQAISENNDIKDQSFHNQWRQLIHQPLSRLDRNSSQLSYLMIVDALDECENENDIRTILQLLAEVRSLKSVRLRIFLTSRPEIPIRHGVYQLPNDEHQDFVLHNISPTIVDHDIRVFLEHNLGLIREDRSMETDWPGPKAIGCLVNNASGLFIWAATTCRFIREGKKWKVIKSRLSSILRNSNSITEPEKHLNEIYITVLKHSIDAELSDEEKEGVSITLRDTLGSIAVLLSPLSIHALSRLLFVSKEEINETLEDLHAILDIPKDQTRPLRLHHPSFRDFLLDKERCTDPNFQVDELQAHQVLAENCIRIMSDSLKQDICGLDTPGAHITNVENSRVEQHLLPEVQYACLYWIQHLQKSGAQLYDNDQVHRFLQEHSLHWLEALSWMRKVSEGIYAITSLESIAFTLVCPRLSEFIYDMKRFILYNRPAIEQAPLQIYCSAIVFAPAMSIVRKRFKDLVPRWVQRLPKVEKDWNALLQTLEGHLQPLTAVAFSLDGKVLASASGDKTVKLWDASSGAMLQTLEDHLGSATAVAFSPVDGKVLASASRDNTVKLWDTGSGQVLRTHEGHSDVVSALAFSPDGKVLASASFDKTVKLWDASSGAVLQTLGGHSNFLSSVAFSPDGKLLASASGDGTVKLRDAGSGAVLLVLRGHSSYVSAVAFSPDGSMLASASDDNRIKLWEAGSGALLQTLQTVDGRSGSIHDVAFSPDGTMLASASWDKTVRLWDAGSGTVLQTLEGHRGCVRAVRFSPDGKVLASASEDKTLKLWDTGPGAVLQAHEGHSRAVSVVSFSPDGKVLASASWDKTIKLWDTGSGVVQKTLEGHSHFISAVAFSSDGELLASASWDTTVKLWDTGSGAALQTLEGHPRYITAVAFSPDKVLAWPSDNNTVKLWDAGSRAVLKILEGHSDFVSAVAFSSNGKVLASASYDNTVRLWDAGSGEVLQTLKGHSDFVSAVAFSPDGKVLASASADKTVKLWDMDVSSEEALQTIPVNAIVQNLSFSDDKICLQTGGALLRIALPSHGMAVPRLNHSRAIFVEEQWVGRDTENMLWLSSEHRPQRVAVYGSVVALGYGSGRVSILEFAF